jgi:DNA-binding CsgD family transcriptional regulator/PAS domain-containing protein
MDALRPENLSSIIADIYDCALEPGRWNETLIQINSAVQGAYTTISLSDPKFSMPRMVAHSPWDPVMLKILNEEYGVDGVPGLKEVAFGDVDAPNSTFNQMSEEAFQTSKFYREWVQPQGLREGCVMKFAHTADRIGAMAFITHASRDVITADERRFMAAISPHIRRAALIGDLLDFQRVQTKVFQQTLDGLAAAVFIVNGQSHVVHANGAATAMLSDHSSVIYSDQVLSSANPNTAGAFADAIARAGSGHVDLGGRGIGIPVSPPGQPPAVAYVLPLRANTELVGSIGGVAAVFVSSTKAAAPPPQNVLATLYDLTPSEARVMLLIAEGAGVPAVALQLGVAETTIKTHLGRVFNKTGSANQGELIKLVLALSPPTAA